MRLFHVPFTTSQVPYIVINELGINCDIVKTSFEDKTELLKYNAKGKVPALVLDNGQTLTECSAILQYLADLKPEANIIPKFGSWERYRTLEAVNFVATELHGPLGAWFVDGNTDESKSFNVKLAEKKLDYLNTYLGKNQFMACDQYTIADSYCFVVVGWTKWVGIDMSKYPNILGYAERMSTRPAISKTIKADSAQ